MIPTIDLTDAITSFQSEILRIAHKAAREFVFQELTPIASPPPPAAPPPAPPRASPKPRAAARPSNTSRPPAGETPKRRRARQDADAREQLNAFPPEMMAPPRPEPGPTADVAAPEPVSDPPSEPVPTTHPAAPRKRYQWTKETIVNELVSWFGERGSVDESLVLNHSPPGMAKAILRIFGRIGAAINVAALEFNKRFPDGPPKRTAVARAKQEEPAT